MEIFIRLAGVQLGPYSDTQVRQHLTDGLLSVTDSARSPEMEEWVTLAEVLAKAPPPTVALPHPEVESETELEPESPMEPEFQSELELPMEAALQPEPEPAMEAEPQQETEPPVEVALQPEPESEVEEIPEERPRAPEAPPGVQHLPTRARDPEPEDYIPLEKKTILLGPTSPRTSRAKGSPPSSPATTSPMLGSSSSAKKTSRASLVKAMSQNTSPLPTRIIDPPPGAPPVPPVLGKPKFPAANEADLKKEDDPLARSLTAKTVPMRSTPSAPAQSASTIPLPSRQMSKPSSPPPSVVDDLTKKLGKKMVMPDPVQTSPPTIGLETGKKKGAPFQEKQSESDLGPEEDEDEANPGKRGPRRIMPALIFAWAVLASFIAYYIWSPYHAAASLQTALSSGDPAALDATIDFPAVRASLKEQVKNQLAQSGATDASVLSMLNNSIDLYVTPGGISELVTKSNDLAQGNHDQLMAPDIAAKILLALDGNPPKSQGLASPSDFVVDREMALLHLRFQLMSLGWKLNHIDMNPDWLSAASPGSTSPLLLPVVNTYLEAADAKAKKSDWAGAAAGYSQVLVVDPQSSIAYNARGNTRQAAGDMDGAIKDYTQAITFDPQMAQAYNNRGNAKALKNDQDGAILDYTQAIQIDPTLASAYDNRGNAKTTKGEDLDGAIADFTQAITLDPNRASAYSNRGFARQANGNLDGAISDYTQALVLAPKTAIAYYNRGLALQAQGNLDGAIADFDHALAFDPKIAGAYYNRGNAKSATHDLDGAIADYTQAVALNPRIAAAYSNRGLVHQAQGDLDTALADFTQTLAVDPKNVSAYFNRGQIKALKNDQEGAIADTTQALALDPKNAPALYTRGLAELTKGKLDGAATDLKQFCDLSPRDHSADRARLYLWVIAKAQNPTADVDQDLSNALENNWNSPVTDQVSKTAAFLLGRTNEADYLTAAASIDAKIDQAQHCQAWCFAGLKRSLAGDKKGAADAFHQCVATGQKDAYEYFLALAELQALEPPPAPPPAASTPAPAPAPTIAPVAPAPAANPAPAPAQ